MNPNLNAQQINAALRNGGFDVTEGEVCNVSFLRHDITGVDVYTCTLRDEDFPSQEVSGYALVSVEKSGRLVAEFI